jgi:hypothetical protein
MRTFLRIARSFNTAYAAPLLLHVEYTKPALGEKDITSNRSSVNQHVAIDLLRVFSDETCLYVGRASRRLLNSFILMINSSSCIRA